MPTLKIKKREKVCWSKITSLQKKPEIDEINAKILRMLLCEARTSFTQIAKECKISVNSVRNRFEQLKKVAS